MTTIPDEIMRAGRECLSAALRDERTGFAIQATMHSKAKAAFEEAIARAIMAEREACAAIALNRHRRWAMPHPDDARPSEVCDDTSACEDISNAILKGEA